MLSINLKKEKTFSVIKKENIIKRKEMIMKAYLNKRLLYTFSLNFSNFHMHKWQNITNLILSNRNISSLPMELGLLPFLLRINLSHNDLAQSKWTWLEQATIKKKLIKLDISDNSLTELPLQIVKLNTLKCLKACFNKFRHLPQSICRLQNLKYLYLSHNKLEILPASLTILKLKFLDISENLLTQKDCDSSQNFTFELDNYFGEVWKIPTLKELSAKIILHSRIPYDTIPSMFVKYLDEANYCCVCKKACIDINKKADIDISSIMLEKRSEKIVGVSKYDVLKLESYICSSFCSEDFYSSFIEKTDEYEEYIITEIYDLKA